MTDRGETALNQLRDLARQRRLPTELLISRLLSERLLARFAASDLADRLVLKGAHIFRLIEGDLIRASKDLDLLLLSSDDADRVLDAAIGADQASELRDDGVVFDWGAATCVPLHGVGTVERRLKVPASVGSSRQMAVADLVYGHPVTPGPERRWMHPILHSHQSFPVLSYPVETVLAEKLAPMLEFGRDNTRLKDFYDVWVLVSRRRLDGRALLEAVERTFATRDAGHVLDKPESRWREGIGPGLATPANERAWRGWLSLSRPVFTPPSLSDLLAVVETFALPLLRAAAWGTRAPNLWCPEQGWAAFGNATRSHDAQHELPLPRPQMNKRDS
ncbi:nucleotidyl transferase AbiEii/AbiGii toxin family protein [Falsiroseomonas sp. HW251]|uniref:nucleotidyl transferase AbiEii/AbiGii toxin family protein n=1 Tax=Falsiroseomonas sp. HW251 TaxID=3390998 RepID=UPI003D317273